MKRTYSFVFAGGLALAVLAAGTQTSADAALPRAKANPVRIGVQWLGQDKVEVVVTNTSRKTLRIPAWQLPSMAEDMQLFRISRDGQPVQYLGKQVKRGLPSAADFAILRPGRSVRTVVSLAKSYDLSKAGTYTVAYAALTQYASLSGGEMLKQANGSPMVAQGAPIRIALDAGLVSGTHVRSRGLPANPVLSDVLGVTYIGCSSTQIADNDKAMLSARSYTENAKGYLNAGTTGPRYTSWFGTYTSNRYATAKQHFVAIDAAMDQTGGQVSLNCTLSGCNSGVYAYVYSNLPYEIHLCSAYWSAPLVGTDSKAGTLIHEMSHFTVVAGTSDFVYGQTNARNLANTNPDNAVNNADNHEYFSENTPAEN